MDAGAMPAESRPDTSSLLLDFHKEGRAGFTSLLQALTATTFVDFIDVRNCSGEHVMGLAEVLLSKIGILYSIVTFSVAASPFCMSEHYVDELGRCIPLMTRLKNLHLGGIQVLPSN
jgi:hypothetical protein